MIKSRPTPKAPASTPPTQEELDEFHQIWADAMCPQDEEVLRRTTRGVPDVDINFIDFEDD